MTASTAAGSCLTAKGLDISLAALQRQDPYINNIVDVASQVALYTFSSKANEWEKTDVEGTLFVYTRLASPRHGFTIMNRLSMENLTEPITKDLDFQLQDPFLLYRNARLAIHGIWFYDKTDCQRIAELMKNLTRQEQQVHSQQQLGGWVSPRALPDTTTDPRGVDILQMLTKARSEYDKGKVSSEPKEISGGGEVIHDNPHLIKPIPLKPTDRNRLLQHQDGDSKPMSLISLFGSQQQQQHAGLVPSQVTSRAAVGGVVGVPLGVGGRPAVARSLSYDDPSAQTVAVSPGGGPLLAPVGMASSPSSSVPPQHCAAIQKLMSAQGHGHHRGVPDIQPLAQSPDKHVCENGLKRGGGGGGGEGGDPLQKLFPNAHTALHPAPPPPSSSSSSVSAPCCPQQMSHPPPLMPGLIPVRPPEAMGGAHHHHHHHHHQHQHPHIHQHQHLHHQQQQQQQQHLHQQQYQHQQSHLPQPQQHHQQQQQPQQQQQQQGPPPAPPVFYSPKRPLLPTPIIHPLQVGPGVLQPSSTVGGSDGMAPPAQLSAGLLAVHMAPAGMPAAHQVNAGGMFSGAQVNAGVLAGAASGLVQTAQLGQVNVVGSTGGMLPAEQVNAGVLRLGQGAVHGSGVVSPHELLQRLQLVQQEQTQNQNPGVVACEPSRPPLAPCFRLARPVDNNTSGGGGGNTAQVCPTSNQHFQVTTTSSSSSTAVSASEGSTLLMSPSVFSLTKPPPPRNTTEPSLAHTHAHGHILGLGQPPLLPPPPPPEETRALSRSQLQATLIHLIQTDSSFLDVIYEAYVSRLAKDPGTPHY
ncbi:mRNA-decapping enzyme 1B isoform X2 [Engraulis encrasicolus]|uniref:mRNA-decapping enzyme 1B isoform X2 n=1 Tax=Engraulis encrasicolus TaxID=184585 RepID=UPI002FD2D4FE